LAQNSENPVPEIIRVIDVIAEQIFRLLVDRHLEI